MSSSGILAEYALSRMDDIPTEVVGAAKIVVADTIACMIGGSRTEPGRCLGDLASYLGGNGQAALVGLGARSNLVQAAYVNGQLADILDFEDTFVGHPSAAVIPAAFAAGEAVDCSGKDLLKAIVAGYEVCMRVALAIQPVSPMAHASAGVYYFHSFGATAAAGRLFGLSVRKLDEAFGTAAAHTPLPLWIAKWERPLHWVKNNFGGQTAAGIAAVLLARTGYVGVANILDNPLGFWTMVGSDRYDRDTATRNLGTEYLILQDTLKPYSACRWLHGTLDAVERIMKAEHAQAMPNVRSVTVRGPKHLASFDHRDPQTLVDAEFSLPYTVSQVLLGAVPGPDWFGGHRLQDPVSADLSRRVSVVVDPELEALYRDTLIRPVVVSVVTEDGRRLEQRVDYPKGDTMNPMTVEEVWRKFTRLVSPVFGPDRAAQIWETVQHLDSMAQVSGFLSSLAGPEASIKKEGSE